MYQGANPNWCKTYLTIRDQTYQCNYLLDIQQCDQNFLVLFCLRGFEFWEKPVECRVVEVQWIMRAKQDWILCNQTNFTTNGQPFGIRVGSGCDYHRHDHCDHHLCQHHQHYQGREHDLSRDFLLTKADTESWNCGNYKKRSNHQFIKCPFISEQNNLDPMTCYQSI